MVNKNQVSIDAVTILKGIAIIGVVLVHSPLCIKGINPYLSQLTRIGQFGCQLFFLLSGYLMMLSWDRLKSNSFKNKVFIFYKKRIGSILPVYFLSVIFYQIISLIYEHYWNGPFFYEIHHELYSIVLNLFLLQGLDYVNFNSIVPGGWFIGTIVLFYLLYPFLRRILDRIAFYNYKLCRLLPFFAFLISLIVQIVIYYYNGSWIYSNRGSFIYYSILNQLPCMMTGMLLGVYKLDEEMRKISTDKLVIRMFAYFILALFLFYIMRMEYYVYIALPYILSLSFYYLYYVTVVITEKTNIMESIIGKNIAKFGDLSFAVYFSNFFGGMFIPWFVVRLLENNNFSYSSTILYVLLLSFIYIISYYIALPIQSFIDLSKKRIK